MNGFVRLGPLRGLTEEWSPAAVRPGEKDNRAEPGENDLKCLPASSTCCVFGGSGQRFRPDRRVLDEESLGRDPFPSWGNLVRR